MQIAVLIEFRIIFRVRCTVQNKRHQRWNDWFAALLQQEIFENVGYAEQDKAGVYNILIMEERQTIIACGAGSTTKLVLPEKIRTSSGKETNLIRVENVKNITEYIDRIDEMIERKEALFEKD